ncbi:MAG: protein O-GlcNAc transferase [Humisphaera sp.]|nr:protein O-GlcNAc transferase [Humisphaera sp.]
MPQVGLSDALRQAERHLAAGEVAPAEQIARALVQQHPRSAEAFDLLGRIAERVREFAAAAECFTHAIERNPTQRLFHYHLGNAHRLAGRFDRAVAAYRAALRIDPNYTDALVNLGIALASARQGDDAIDAWRGALRLDPNDADALTNLGNIYREMGRLGDAIDHTERALRLRPEQPWLLTNLANAYAQQGRPDRAIELYRRAVAAAPKSAATHSNLLIELMFQGSASPVEIFDEHRAWARAHEEPLRGAIRPHANDCRDPNRRLRIGYVSADFRQHVVSFFFEPILQHHARERFEIFCYSRTPVADEYTRRMQSYGHTWREIFALRDAQVADMIRADGIDILVDLAGHTAHNRLSIFAHKPAPVQASYLGSPGTTGMSAMDYRITDAVNDPPGLTERYYTERLIRLPRCAWAFRPWDHAPPVAPAPPLRERGDVTFGSFNRSSKISDATVATWSRLLLRTPESRLLIRWRSMADDGARRRLFARFADHGIAAERLEARAGSPTIADYLADYAHVDIALDTFPYNGVTTTCDALYMGVPVVALEGDFHAARIGATLLRAAGLDELVARDAEDYARLGSELASDPQRIEQFRHSLRPRIESSPLLDGASLARAIEDAYREMWRTWCATQ